MAAHLATYSELDGAQILQPFADDERETARIELTATSQRWLAGNQTGNYTVRMTVSVMTSAAHIPLEDPGDGTTVTSHIALCDNVEAILNDAGLAAALDAASTTAGCIVADLQDSGDEMVVAEEIQERKTNFEVELECYQKAST